MNTIVMMRNDVGTGAGSRGGKVIGRTKTGKPIYMNHNHPSHGDFNAGDHKDAAKHHEGQVAFHQSLAERMKSNADRLQGDDKKEVLGNAKKNDVAAKAQQTAADHHNKQAEKKKTFGVKGETKAEFAASAKSTHELMKAKDTRGL